MIQSYSKDKSELNGAAHRDSTKVKFDMQSTSNRSNRSRRGSRRRSKRSERNANHEYEEEMQRLEMHLPYWERKSYRSYKQIKVLQPKIETQMDEYIRIKIDEQEKRLVKGALSLKKNLKAIDKLPHNGIMSDMIKFTHRRTIKGHSVSAANMQGTARETTFGWASHSPS